MKSITTTMTEKALIMMMVMMMVMMMTMMIMIIMIMIILIMIICSYVCSQLPHHSCLRSRQCHRKPGQRANVVEMSIKLYLILL